MSDDAWIPYFAFGANLSTNLFCNVRKMRPKTTERAVLRGYELKFSEPGVLPFIEPAFASIEPAESGVVHGVLYRINADDFRRLNLSESANYERLDVMVVGDTSGEVIAKAYASKYPKEGLIPSRRYRNLIAAGAREHGLPAEYCQMIDAQRAAYVPGVSELFWLSLKPYIKLREKGFRHEVVLNWLRRR